MRSQTLTLNRIPNDRLIAMSIMFWSIVGLLGTTKSSIYYSLIGVPTYWPHLSLHHLANGIVWVALTPIIYYLIRWFSEAKSPIVLIVIAGIPISICQSILSLELDIIIRWSLGFIPASNMLEISAILPDLLSRVSNTLVFYFIVSGLIYYALNHFFSSAANYSNSRERELATDSRYPSKLYLKQSSGFNSFKTSDIGWVKSEGNYVRIYNLGHFSMIRQTIKNIELKLDPAIFYRLNRSCIVNMNFISELKPHYNGEYLVVLQNGQTFITTKTFREHVQRLKMHLQTRLA